MPQPTSKHSDAAWAKAFQEIVATRERRPQGDGWVISADLRKRLKMSRRQFYAMVKTLQKAGRAEAFTGQVLSNGKLNRAQWYRLTTPSATKRSGRSA